MIWRLTYCNKKGVEARVDIIKGDRTPVEIVQGSANPFTLSYKLDKNDKSGHIMTSSADIEIFETETFNIDDLKTSNETELKVEYFEGNVLTWAGFILPDFFSREIGSPNIVRMTASDRLTALKGVTLSDLPIRVSLRDLIELSLEQTGLDLALVAQVQINQGSTNILDAEILSQRLTDTRGRSISCYDILMSIMVATNSTIRQREGQWVVYNKLEHELRTPTIFFDKVERGAIRTIQPVASSVGVYHEHGGGLTYPTNYNFSDGLNGWTAVNGFVASVNDKRVEEFELIGNSLHPIYGDVTNVNYLVNKNEQYMANESAPYIVSEQITIPYPVNSEVAISVDMNAISAVYPPESLTVSRVDFVVVATKGSDILFLNKEGVFTEAENNLPVISSHMHRMVFSSTTPYIATSRQMTVNGVLTVEDGFVSDYTISVRIYGSGTAYTALINSVAVRFNKTKDTPKGTIFKTTQGSNFTKLHDVETTILGDYITSGLNGYFYDYPVDDTSNLYLPSGTLSSPTWITAFDTTERPLLHHISRQKSRLFSVAHDILKANINVESFDPLAVFQDCKGGKYVVVSASFDFLRSEVDVELEQIAYDNTILKRDFIYSYFGEGESNIKSIGGIAGGGGTGGGGMTSEQLEMLTNLADWWRLDEENDAIYSLKSVYSLKGVSALGLGSGGGGGGGDFDRLDDWADYNETKANWVLSALLGYDLHTRVNTLEASGVAIDIAITGSGNAVTDVSKSGNTLTFYKGINFATDTAIDNIAIGGRNLLIGSTDEWKTVNAYSSQVYINVPFSETKLEAGQTYVFSWETELLSGSPTITTQVTLGAGDTSYQRDILWTGRPIIGKQFRVFTPTENQLALGDSFMLRWYTNNEEFSFRYRKLKLEKGNKPSADWSPSLEDQVSDWNTTNVTSFSYIKNKPTTLAGYGITDVYTKAEVNSISDTITTALNTHISNGTVNAKHLTDAQLAYLNDLIGWWKVDALGNLYTEKNLYSTKGVSALGLGDGSGGGGDGGADMLDSWANYTTAKADYYVPASLLVPFRDDTLSRLTSLEAGVGGRNYFSINDFVADNKARGYSTIEVIQHEGNIAYRSSNITYNHLIPRYLQGKFEANTQYYLQFKINWESYTNSDAQYVISVVYTDGTTSNLAATTSQTSRSMLTSDGKTIDYITTTRQYDGTVVIYEVQIEKANKPSDWKPAPEDQISDWNVTDATSFSFIKNKPTLLSQFTDNIGVASHIANTSNPHNVTKSQVGLGNVDNVKQATKSEFDSHIANKANPHAVTTAQIGAVNLTTNQTITGAKTFDANITLGVNKYIQGTDNYTGVWNVDNLLWRFGSSKTGSVANIRSEKVGIGTDNPLYKLDVSGDGRFTGEMTAKKLILSSTDFEAQLAFSRPSINYLTAPLNGSMNFITNSDTLSSSNSVLILSPNGNVGVGKGFTNSTTAITAQLHVRGNILSTGEVTASTGVSTPKVDFGNGFTIEPSGTELVFKYNGVIKQRMLSTGTILATGGITALTT